VAILKSVDLTVKYARAPNIKTPALAPTAPTTTLLDEGALTSLG